MTREILQTQTRPLAKWKLFFDERRNNVSDITKIIILKPHAQSFLQNVLESAGDGVALPEHSFGVGKTGCEIVEHRQGLHKTIHAIAVSWTGFVDGWYGQVEQNMIAENGEDAC
jgi:hypothetical protein